MNELFAVIAPLLLVDVLNPVFFAVLIFAAGGSRPVANSSALLLGHTMAYFVVGIGASYAVDAIADRLANPRPMDFGIQLLVGLACLYSVLPSREGGVLFAQPVQQVVGAAIVQHLPELIAVVPGPSSTSQGHPMAKTAAMTARMCRLGN